MALFSFRKKIILLALGAVFLLALVFAITFASYVITPKDIAGKSRVVEIPEGATFKEVASILENSGIIHKRNWFLAWGKLLNYSRNIKSGEYRLSSSMPPIKVLNILTRGVIIMHPITIPEGYTAKQIAALLSRKGIVESKKFLACVNDPQVLKKYGLPGPTLEGYLYPDTYHFARNMDASKVIDAMVTRFRQVIKPYKERLRDLSMDLKDLITLASIVEKETGVQKERPLIASVFLNRLKRGMRLESDPTVIYGLKDFDGNLTRKDLAKQTPYNTYVIRGLPPGPIANPGIEAIKAVLYPAKTEYLYFVSKNDGSHYFSKTLEEHNRAVNIYQKKRRRREKTP